MLDNYPHLQSVVKILDGHLQKKHAVFFGPKAVHPVLEIKRSKIIHDNLWGTNCYYWRELLIIDSPIFQRLRFIHQVGLSFQVYMAAHHTRFEHSLGAVAIAQRILNELRKRRGGEIDNVIKVILPNEPRPLLRLTHEMRLAALLHDVGHSIHSHTSEQVFGALLLMEKASAELSDLVGKDKGAAEVLSFCLALSTSIKNLLDPSNKRFIGGETEDDYDGPIDFVNVALMIVGRSFHPFFQFLGDIISSGFDADKLDYLLRDATNSGLPLSYDLDRYLSSVTLEKGILTDGEGCLNNLYQLTTYKESQPPESKPACGQSNYPYYESYRLRLPAKGMNALEQIVICKLMLFSYIYHHAKVRASEGMLKVMLKRIVKKWQKEGLSDSDILVFFLDFTDASLGGELENEASSDPSIQEYPYRLLNRLLPREVYKLEGSATTHAERSIIIDFLTDLQDPDKKDNLVIELQNTIAKYLQQKDASLGDNLEEILLKTGVWVDVPKPPSFEDIDDLIIKGHNSTEGVPLKTLFPIGQWIDAYQHYKYPVRIFAFSEFREKTIVAAKTAMQDIIGIKGNDFYETILRKRG